MIGGSAKCLRWVGILLCIFGFYGLFAPVIQLLNMIPFVGWLLSWIVAVAAVIFAVVVGLTLSVLTIAVAWVFFRPLIGIPLLLIVAASTYLIFFFDWGGEAEGENTTPTTNTGTTTNPSGGATILAATMEEPEFEITLSDYMVYASAGIATVAAIGMFVHQRVKKSVVGNDDSFKRYI